jgi:hypothetical protein
VLLKNGKLNSGAFIMKIPEMSEDELKMAALSSAMASVLASVACENALLRSILKEHGLLSDEEWTSAMREFSASKWKTFQTEIDAKIRQQAERALARMTRGPVH